jgi:outer membrane protein
MKVLASVFFVALFAVLNASAEELAKPSPTPSPTVSASPDPSLSPAPVPQASPVRSNTPFSLGVGTDSDTSMGPAIELPDLTLDKTGGVMLTMRDSIRLAIQTATAVLKADINTQVNGAALLQSYGQFLPSLSGRGNYAYQTGNQYLTAGQPTVVSGSNLGAGYSLTADLNLFNGLSDFSGLKSSLLRKDAANLSLLRAKQAVALDITQSFLQVVLDNQLVDIARKNLQESRERERLLQEQTKLGARNLSDLFRQQAQTSSDESLLLTSENKTRTDQILFLRKLRADVAKNYHFSDPALPEEKAEERFQNEGALLRTALANRADLKATDETADAAHWDVKSNWSGYLPKLDLAGGLNSGASYLYSQNVNGQTVVPPTQSTIGYQLGTQVEYTLGVYLTWNIFDRFLTRENVAKARAVADDADIDAQDFRNEVEGDVRQAYGNYETSIAQLRSSKKGLVAAEKAYEVIEGRYEVGSAAFIDLVTAQATLLQAETARAQALIDFMLQAKSVEFATGEIQVE